jgi:hypothetical protein
MKSKIGITITGKMEPPMHQGHVCSKINEGKNIQKGKGEKKKKKQ